MCGIAGIIIGSSRRTSSDQLVGFASAMDRCLEHRGPDGHDVWCDHDAGLALVHRRLAIVDLSSAGHQPMHSADGRFVISYNGEVYSYVEIRKKLEAAGQRFRGHSDTEVILESIARYGITETMRGLIGMFAIAIWDRKDRTLTLVRDRLGIKPVYWAKLDGVFMFASELKALREYPEWTPRINPEAVASYMRHNYVPAPHTIYQNVHKLEPGTILTLPWNSEPRLEKFWNARDVAIEGIRNPLREDDAALTDRLESLLIDAVGKRMMADVPLGAFLSGGIDSSLVVALMKAANSGPVKTFSIGFEQPEFNEAPYAAAIAKHLQTEHTELMVSSREALDVVPRLGEMFDEPFADSSQIPTFLVSAMTRKHVTVALSGDGGDELFAGYNRYQLTSKLWKEITRLPAFMRKGAAFGLTSISTGQWDKVFAIWRRYRPLAQPGRSLHKLASALDVYDATQVYRRIVSHWDPASLMPNISETVGALQDASIQHDFPNLLDRMQFLDLTTYLPDDILTKVDRTSMAVSLEARVPLLDHRVVELAWRLPHSVKIKDGKTKWLLRQVLYRHVPSELVERPKMGFGVPLGDWLRGPLRAWAEELLSEQRLNETGLFNSAMVRQHWEQFLSGKSNWEYLLWDLLMFEAWRERWG
jgi:asparagine synthase (glutamine-hydrolysing)